MTATLSSKRAITFDVPDPRHMKAKFVYNYFEPNERITESTSPSKFKSAVKNKSDIEKLSKTDIEGVGIQIKKGTSLELPRFIMLNWTVPFILGDTPQTLLPGNYNLKNDKILQDELAITTTGLQPIRIGFPGIRERLTAKLNALSNLLGLSDADGDQTTILANDIGKFATTDDGDDKTTGDLKDLIASIILPTNDPKKVLVNDTFISPNDRLTAASSVSIGMHADSGHKAIFYGYNDVSPLENAELEELIKGAPKTGIENALQESEVFPSIAAQRIGNAHHSWKPGLFHGAVSGYIITRHESVTDIKGITTVLKREFVIRGGTTPVLATSYLDKEVKYGRVYTYAVSALWEINAVMLETKGKKGTYRFRVRSAESNAFRIVSNEIIPPAAPDGLFYSFNYTKGKGLILRWQFPPGRSKDVKYFQIFRRSSINDPFQCIAMYDFNDTVIKQSTTFSMQREIRTLFMPETVRLDRIYELSGALNEYEDASFTRDNSYIYAVAAVDAHGLSSGYSVQTRVSFNKRENSLVLHTISQANGPKQYPNFYIDPTLDDNIFVDTFSLDAIKDSGHKMLSIYLNPDTAGATYKQLDVTAANKNLKLNEEKILKFSVAGAGLQDPGGIYQLQIINVDRQKAVRIPIKIVDDR